MLRYVVALAEEQHFGRAARRAHVAQSALSQQVKQLETELGVRLFDRTTRSVAITEAGERFLAHARGILNAADRATADMQATADGLTGAVTVGFVGTATYDVLPRVAQRVRALLPDIDLSLRGELLNPALLDGVRSGDLDLALVRPGEPSPDGLDLHHLRHEKLVAVLPDTHPLASRHRIELGELAGNTFVIHPSGDRSSIHQLVLAACSRAGFQPSNLVQVSETSTLVVSVAARLGVALVPEPVRSLRLDGVSYVDLVDAPMIGLSLVARAGESSPATGSVAAAIRQCVDDR
ncbi:LysR substrate-binding domain-containing protein [soil metagenome]